MLADHGELTHTYYIYQSAIKVPLIFKLPGQNKSTRIKTIAGLIDIVPTVCGLLGIETPKNVQGVDLFAGSNGDDISGRKRHMYCESHMPTKYKANSLLGVVNDRYKYIQTTRPELYDLIQDPAESNNLIDKQQQQAEFMKVELAQILDQSQREASPDSQMEVDARTMEQIKSLGYAGGSVTEDFSFDQTKDDPKDLAQYHLLNVRCGAYQIAKEYDKAEIVAKQMIQLQPDCVIAYERLSSAAMRQKNYFQAIAYSQKVIELDPNNAEAYNRRGIAHAREGQLGKSIADFSQVIRLNPKYLTRTSRNHTG